MLPGQVHTYFGGSEQNVFRAYRNELNDVLLQKSSTGGNGTSAHTVSVAERTSKIQDLFGNAGLTKTAKQSYEYASSGRVYRGENVYAILQAPRGDGKEAIVLVAALKNIEGENNVNGVPVLIALSRYFKRWSLWSKDIIFLVTEDSLAGPQAWIDAYHSEHDQDHIDALPLKSGALQGAVCIDYPFGHPFDTLHISYDGVNGQLPNLDLFNTAVVIASGQMGIPSDIQHIQTGGRGKGLTYERRHDDSYLMRLQTLLNGMVTQAIGHATGPHSVFIPYHIDAITLTAVGQGPQDEMALGRVVESICRSLNNLLEHLHQSFFFYLLMHTNRFVSIGTYLPSAMAIAAGYTVIALWLWRKAGHNTAERPVQSKPPAENGLNGKDATASTTNLVTKEPPGVKEKTLPTESKAQGFLLPLTLAVAVHTVAPILPIYLATQLTAPALFQSFFVFGVFGALVPVILASVLPEMKVQTTIPSLCFSPPTDQQHMILRSLSLLWTGACLTVLATLNFSLSMFLGVVGAPVAFCARTPERPAIAGLQYLLLLILSPMGLGAAFVAYVASTGAAGPAGVEQHIQEILVNIAFAWKVWGSWGVLVGVWVIWWPAWLVAAIGVASSWYSDTAAQLQTSLASDPRNDEAAKEEALAKKPLEPKAAT